TRINRRREYKCLLKSKLEGSFADRQNSSVRFWISQNIEGQCNRTMIVGQIMILNLVIAAGMLIYTSYLDLEKREVEDKVWLIFGGIGGVLQAYEIGTGQASLITLGIALALAT